MAVLTRNSGGMSRRPEESFMPLSQAMNRLFQDSFLFPSGMEGLTAFGNTSGTNLWEAEDSYVLQVAVPGMKPDGLQLTFEQNLLTIKGEPAIQAPENAKAIWQSLGGQAEYRVQIPGEVDSGAAAATYEAGILTVRLPKAQHARARTIQVTAK